MDAGNELCDRHQTGAAVAFLGVSEIHGLRRRHHGDVEDSATKPIPRAAYVLDSLKRPAEVTQLRRIYGDHLILIGLQASNRTRMRHLVEKITPTSTSHSQHEIAGIAESLLQRDLAESGDYGQNMLKTFPQADVFVDVDLDVSCQIMRLLDLLFGKPDGPTPSMDEFGMQLAHVTSLRSPELGLRVGAAMLREKQTVISVGVNAHPTSGVTPAYDASAVEIKKLVLAFLKDLGDDMLKEGAAISLKDEPDTFVSRLMAGPLASSRIHDLTEFQLPVHAEMSAVLDAVRTGSKIEDCTLYVTAYPCHGCAKHLLALGIRVSYLEPYPKSRAAAMYGDEATLDFKPFTGIAPRRYEALFGAIGDRKDLLGLRKRWGETERKFAQPLINLLITQEGINQREELALASLQQPANGESPQAQ